MVIDRRGKVQRALHVDLIDSTRNRYAASELFGSINTSDYKTTLATLGHQLIKQNLETLSLLNIEGHVEYNGRDIHLIFETSSTIGVVPLKSPISGKNEISLIVKPRFDWEGIGVMMEEMGWKINPMILKLPLLPETERSIPNWVIATTILFRIRLLLKSIDRKFGFIEENLSAPKGSVNWLKYAQQNISRLNLLQIPCRYPTLDDDLALKGTIHFTLRKVLNSLESQKKSSIVVLQLIDVCKRLIELVQQFQPLIPTKNYLSTFQRNSLRAPSFKEGIEAIEWTIDNTGLAGLGDLRGLPWLMNMESLFEAWIESIFEKIAYQGGWKLRTGRKRETLTPIRWEHFNLGSQKYLLPDVIIERGTEVVIVDAKYKRHWEELSITRWLKLDEELRENHRDDFLQILAYSTLYENKQIKCYLVYPCKMETYLSLLERGRLFNKGTIYAGSREIEICLTAAPFGKQGQHILQNMITSLS